MAYFEIKDVVTSVEVAVDQLVEKINSVTGYTCTKVSASTFVFEGPAKDNQRWSVQCVIGKSSSTRFYKMHAKLGEGLNGNNLINSSGQIAPEENGKYNSDYDHLFLLNQYTKIQLFVGSGGVIIRIWSYDGASAEQYTWRPLWVFALGESAPEYGSKPFILGSTPQVKRPRSQYRAFGLGSLYQTGHGSVNRNIMFLKHDGSGGKTWGTSTIQENGLYGANNNTERRYEAIKSKLFYSKSLTSVFLPIFIRSGGVVYGELDGLKMCYTKYLATGNTITYNSNDWHISAVANYGQHEANALAFALKV